MIQGIGVDIIEVERFQRSITRFGDRLITKLFTHNEIHYCYSQMNPAMYFASFFAAKEALSKALATGNTGIFGWKDVEVLYLSNGKPALQIYNLIAERLKSYNTILSLSMSEMHVAAFVIIQSH
ncbi:MAG: holo-ACP synthase [Bacteroidota bacterium]|nr:holo-ACP synthase [Bacteroidota bacterium]